MTSRRKFITQTVPAALYLSSGHWLSGCTPRNVHKANTGYRVLDWTGDSFGPMHKIRDGWNPKPPAPSRKVDVAIIGSGIAGLTAALKLKDRDLLVLERETELGGNSKSGSYQGLQYSKGAAYLVDIEEPFGSVYSELGLKFEPIHEIVDSTWTGSRFVPFEKTTYGGDFERLKKFFENFLENKHFPCIPISKATGEALKLDRISLLDYLKGNYAPDLIQQIDTYCFSAIGAGIAETSAYAGLNFYSEIATPVYACPGGNGLIAKKLVEKIEAGRGGIFGRGASVYSVEDRGSEVWVSYFPSGAFSEPNPQLITVAAKHAIVSIPYLFVPRIVKSLKPEISDALRSVKYGSYLVANLCFDEVVFSGGYDHWVAHGAPFTDFIDAGFIAQGAGAKGERRPFVLSVYAPYREPLTGRYDLFVGLKDVLAQRIIAGVQNVAPFNIDSLREVCLTRYGHQVQRCPPGQIQKLHDLPKQFGRVLLAHSDSQGMPSIESAITEGLNAASAI